MHAVAVRQQFVAASPAVSKLVFFFAPLLSPEVDDEMYCTVVSLSTTPLWRQIKQTASLKFHS